MKDEQKKGFSERDWDLLFFLMFKNSSENAKRQLPRSEWSFRLFRRYGNQIFAIRTDADRGSPQREWTGERCRRASCHAPTRLDHAPDSCRHADWPIPAIGPATEDRNRFVRSNRKLLAHEFAQVAHSSDLLFIFSAANTSSSKLWPTISPSYFSSPLNSLFFPATYRNFWDRETDQILLGKMASSSCLSMYSYSYIDEYMFSPATAERQIRQ